MAKKKLINPKQIANDRCSKTPIITNVKLSFLFFTPKIDNASISSRAMTPHVKKVINIGDLRSGVISFNITSFKPKTESPNQ